MPVDIGINTPNPFEYAAGLGVDAAEFTQTMNSYGFPGTRFEPYVSETRPGRNGSRILCNPKLGADPVAIDVTCIFELHRRVPRGLLARVSESGLSLFNKVYGSDALEKALRAGGSPESLIRSWQPINKRFLRERQPFLLYP